MPHEKAFAPLRLLLALGSAPLAGYRPGPPC